MTYEESEALTREHLDRAAKEVGVTWQQTGYRPGGFECVPLASIINSQSKWEYVTVNCAPCIEVSITHKSSTFQLCYASTELESGNRNIGRGRGPDEGIIKQFCDAFEGKIS